MAEFLETIERIEASAASVQRLYGGEGQSIRSLKSDSPEYMRKLADAARRMAAAVDGSGRDGRERVPWRVGKYFCSPVTSSKGAGPARDGTACLGSSRPGSVPPELGRFGAV